MTQLPVTSVGGIEIESNSFTTADGTFQRAKNVVVKYRNRLQKRRGFSLLTAAATIPNSSTVIPFNKNGLYVAYDNKLGIVNTTSGTITDLSGSLMVSSGAKVRYAAASNNLYLASSTGVRKIDGQIRPVIDAGLPGALDLKATALNTPGGFLGTGQIAYQITFVRTDNNGNLLEAAPSEYARLVNNAIAASGSVTSGGAVTLTISGGHGLTIGQTYAIDINTTATPGQIPLVTGQLVSVPTSTTLIYNNGVVGTATPVAVTFTTYRNVSLNFTVPAGYTTADSVRVYRTNVSSSVLPPPDGQADPTTMQLVNQTPLTGATSMTVVDTTPDALKGAYLYTNPDLDGAIGANFPPPFSRDIALFRDSLFYANTSQYYGQSLDLINTQSAALTNNVSAIYVVSSANLVIATITGAASTWVLTGTNLGTNFLVGEYITVSDAVVPGNVGTFPITAITTNSVTITNATGAADALAVGHFTRRYLAASSEDFTKVYGGDFQLTPTISGVTGVFDPITNTSTSLLRAMNRDVRGLTYGSYLSTPQGSPGQMQIDSRDLTTQYFLLADSTQTGSAFSPALPISGNSVLADNETRPNRLYFSKQGEPEAVPLLQYVDVGARTSSILRIIPLRDTLIVVTESGVYRLVGTNPRDFAVFPLDLTINCVGADTVTALNNLVYMLSNQGVVAVSDSGASVMSTPIEPLLQAVNSTSTLADQSNAVAYESERLYLLSTISPRATAADVVYCYNVYTNSWTTWDTVFQDAAIDPADDKLYLLNTSLRKERKLNNNLDFTDESYSISLSNISADGKTATLTGHVPQVGWAIYQGTTLGRISEISGTTITFQFPVSFSLGAATLYSSITSELFTNPITAGDPSTLKQFTEFQMQFRSPSCSAAMLNFGSDNAVLAIPVAWSTLQSIDNGWGNGSWGNFTWGNANGIDTVYETETNQIVRVFVPLLAQRSTYLMTRIIHSQAAESFNLQALIPTARAYSNRTTR